MSAVNAIFGGDLDWLFWRPSRPHPDSAWLGHVPFAHWLVATARPRLVVELGTHVGTSYSAMCEAVLRRGLDAKCYAVDTWQGDRHAGTYSGAVFAELTALNGERYGKFSTLLRMTFDDAVAQFADGSIDLLHIDGLHTYEAVRHDYETWRPKLSDRAIVLFHDIAERRDDFGVWQYWAELRANFRSFEFEHAHGLGVLLFGNKLEGAATKLFADIGLDDIGNIRKRFEALGETPRWMARAVQLGAENRMLKARLAQRQ